MPDRSAHFTLILALAAARGPDRTSAPPLDPAELQGRYATEIAKATACLAEFMAAFNKRDLQAWEATFNFPHVRFRFGQVTVIRTGEQPADLFTNGFFADWHYSRLGQMDVIRAGPDEVHITTRFNRYRNDGSLIGGFDSVYIVTKVDGHWGVQARSSLAA